MAWDTERTKRKILQAAVAEFARLGLDGTTVEKIAKSTGTNKERVHNCLGEKRALFNAVLRSELAKVAQAVPVTSFASEEIGEYAGRAYDYHREHPELSRLIRREGLSFDGELPDEALRREYYGGKIQAVVGGAAGGADVYRPRRRRGTRPPPGLRGRSRPAPGVGTSRQSALLRETSSSPFPVL